MRPRSVAVIRAHELACRGAESFQQLEVGTDSCRFPLSRLSDLSLTSVVLYLVTFGKAQPPALEGPFPLRVHRLYTLFVSLSPFRYVFGSS
jgi:hypothetical protein